MWDSTFHGRFLSDYKLPESLLPHVRCTAEHLIAKQEGGPDSEKNIVAACHWCNSKRHAYRSHSAPDPEKYRAEVQRAMARRLWHPAARWLMRDAWPRIQRE
ncbi:HNH endonuclease [Delftia sp. UME58]|uniref:HNH endonuclease n=1 Tax=Delftia sp. UME58 TaxID=1862322 RepID=UPI0038F624A6